MNRRTFFKVMAWAIAQIGMPKIAGKIEPQKVSLFDFMDGVTQHFVRRIKELTWEPSLPSRVTMDKPWFAGAAGVVTDPTQTLLHEHKACIIEFWAIDRQGQYYSLGSSKKIDFYIDFDPSDYCWVGSWQRRQPTYLLSSDDR